MPVLWNGSPVGLTAYSLSLYPPPAPDTHTLCVRYHSSSLWFLVLSSGCFWTPHPWPSSLYKRNLLLLLCASQKSSVDRKGLKGGPGQWGGVLEHPRVTNRRLAKNIWELFQSYWSYGMKAKLHFCIKKWGLIPSQFFLKAMKHSRKDLVGFWWSWNGF